MYNGIQLFKIKQVFLEMQMTLIRVAQTGTIQT